MRTRVLPVEEWGRLADRPLAARLVGAMDPEDGEVLVVEDGGRIIGSAVLLRAWHMEGVEIDPAYRGRIGWALLRLLRAELKRLSIREVLTMVFDAKVLAISRRIGRVIPLTCQHVAVTVKE